MELTKEELKDIIEDEIYQYQHRWHTVFRVVFHPIHDYKTLYCFTYLKGSTEYQEDDFDYIVIHPCEQVEKVVYEYREIT